MSFFGSQNLKKLIWCAIANVKITFSDDPEEEIDAIRGLLDGNAGDEEELPE